MTSTEEQQAAEMLKQLREILPPELQAKLNAEIRKKAEERWDRFRKMETMVQALAVLHRPGTGERDSFCAECGNVLPCQTVKFIEPYLTAS